MQFKPTIICTVDPGTKHSGLAFTDSVFDCRYDWGGIKMLTTNGEIDVEKSLDKSDAVQRLVSLLARMPATDQSPQIVKASIERPTLHLKRSGRRTRHGLRPNERALQSVCAGLNAWLQSLSELVQIDQIDSLKWQRNICDREGVRSLTNEETYTRYASKMTGVNILSSHSADALCMLDYSLDLIRRDLEN